MKTSILVKAPIFLAVLTLSASAFAAYTQPASTFGTAGGSSVSGTYSNIGTLGQPGITGNSASNSYSAEHGFYPLLGGLKLLYPIISATPGILTFTLIPGTSYDLPLSISNTGSSTLNWAISKNAADSIFSFTPASGTGNSSVTVTANATGLVPSLIPYSNTLMVSGEGISETVLIQLDLTVSPAPVMYTLAVTLKLATPDKGGGTVTSTSVTPQPAFNIPNLSCQRTGGFSDVTCSQDFPAGSTVTLSQTPDSNSQRATWGAPGCGSNPSCQVVLNTPQGTDVTFPYASMARINLGTGYESLVAAYAGAAASDTILARAVTFPLEDLVLNSGKDITLLGGLDAYYAAQSGQYSTLSGNLTVGTGSLVVDRLIIK